MKVVVIGAGVVGYNAALMISREHHNVVVIEQSQEAIDRVRRKLDVMTVAGNGASSEILAEAGVANADLVVAATDVDEVNMMACFTAKRMGAKRTVARLRKDEYIRKHESLKYADLGIDHVVAPEIIAAEEIIDVLSYGAALAVGDFGAGKIKMIEYKVGDAPIVGKPLEDIAFPKPCKIVAIIRPGGIVIPNGRDAIRAGDHIYVVTSREHLSYIEPLFGVPRGAGVPRSISIFGCGRIGLQLAKTLERYNVRVKVIEQRRDRCEMLAAELRQAKVICGDEHDLDMFREDAVSGVDAFVAITARGELNILMALLAKQMGVNKAIAVFNEPEYVPIAERFGLDAAISPLLLSAGDILKFLFRGEVVSLSLLEEHQAEALELLATQNSRVSGKSLKEIGLPKGAIVGAILRNGKAMVPQGSDQVAPGDRVVIVTVPEARTQVERLFGSA